MASDHFDKLGGRAESNPEIQAIYDWAKPAFDNFVEQMDKNEQVIADYRFYTSTFRELIDELRTKRIRRWDVLIQVEYEPDSKEYKRLITNGREPFQTGAYEVRLRSIRNLAGSLKAFSALSDLQQEVEAFSDHLHQARSRQQKLEGKAQFASDELEKARKQLAQKMHGSFASLLRVFWDNPGEVENFYELKYLRAKPLKEDDELEIPREEVTVLANAYAKVLEGQLETGQELRIANNGRKALRVYLSDAVQDEVPEDALTIAAEQYVTMTAGADHSVLVVVNEMDVDGECVVELL